MTVELLAPGLPSDADLEGLVAVLVDATDDNVSAGFLWPFTAADARAWWTSALTVPRVLTWVARDEGRVVGCVQLVLAGFPAGRHRADVSKFLVLKAFRGRGHGRALMGALEEHARRLDRWMLLLDTETGTPAEAIYEAWGWTRYGVVEDFAAGPDGVLKPTTFFVKRLAS